MWRSACPSLASTSIAQAIISICRPAGEEPPPLDRLTASNIATWSERLHERRKHHHRRARRHPDPPTEGIRDGPSDEEAGDDGANRIGSVDGADELGARRIKIFLPVLRALDGVEDGSIVAVEDHARGGDDGNVPVVGPFGRRGEATHGGGDRRWWWWWLATGYFK